MLFKMVISKFLFHVPHIAKFTPQVCQVMLLDIFEISNLKSN